MDILNNNSFFALLSSGFNGEDVGRSVCSTIWPSTRYFNQICKFEFGIDPLCFLLVPVSGQNFHLTNTFVPDKIS